MTLTLSEREKLLKRATVGAVVVASVLIIVKLFAWLSSGSVAMQATLMDSVLDVVASVINFLAVRLSLKPADDEHRFGHGKIEAIAGLGQAAFITGSAVLICLESSRRLITPVATPNLMPSIWATVFAIVLTLGLVLYQQHVVRLTKSTAVAADSIHYKSDILINGSVLVSLIGSQWFEFQRLDPLFGACIAIYILWTAIAVFKASINILMDRELPEEDRDRIYGIIKSHPKVIGAHDLRTRSTGSQYFIQFHLELDPEITVRDGHVIVHEVEDMIAKSFPNADIIIHQDLLPGGC